VQLEEVDLLDAKPAKAPFTLRAQVVGSTALFPLVWTGPRESGLRGNGQMIRVREKSLTYKFLGDIRAIGVGGIDEIDTEFDASAQYFDSSVMIARWSPHAGTRELHCPETESPNIQDAQLHRLDTYH
jgi:hypothetical protein